MATRLPVILTDKASLNPLVSGLALTNELANVAFPESSSKRFTFNLTNASGTVGAGNTPLELFIDGLPNFRFRPAEISTVLCELVLVHTSATGANSAAHTLRFAMTARGGVTSILADGTNVKMPIAAASLVAVSVVANQLVVTATGVAADTLGRWKGRLTVTEITDLG